MTTALIVILTAIDTHFHHVIIVINLHVALISSLSANQLRTDYRGHHRDCCRGWSSRYNRHCSLPGLLLLVLLQVKVKGGIRCTSLRKRCRPHMGPSYTSRQGRISQRRIDKKQRKKLNRTKLYFKCWLVPESIHSSSEWQETKWKEWKETQ